jgi:transposase
MVPKPFLRGLAMSKVTMIGCDVHEATLVLKVAVGQQGAVKKRFAGSEVEEMVAWLKEFAQRNDAPRIVFAYEASGQGFGLYDQLTDAEIECYVLAPTHLPHTTHRRKNKTDDKDADMLLEEVRAHVLAGRKLPAVWVPNPQTRDDREAVRMRLQLGEQRTRIKNQIRNLVKRSRLSFPAWFSKSGEWSRRSLRWLHDRATGTADALAEGARVTLSSLLDLYVALTRELKELDQAILRLARSERYARTFRKLKLMPGVGTLTAMVFLTEIGDLHRFANRRQLAAYLGLAPAAFESGQRDDRKGHITRQGSARVRHVLCQAAWAAVRWCDKYKAAYEKIRRGSSKRTKIAIVAIMRKLGIAMWHAALSKELDPLLDFTDRGKPRKPRRSRQLAVA